MLEVSTHCEENLVHQVVEDSFEFLREDQCVHDCAKKDATKMTQFFISATAKRLAKWKVGDLALVPYFANQFTDIVESSGFGKGMTTCSR